MPMMKRQVYLPMDIDMGMEDHFKSLKSGLRGGPSWKENRSPVSVSFGFPCFPRHFFWLFPGDLSAFAITASQKMNAKVEMEYLK